MDRKIIPEAEAKLTILLTLSNLGPVSNMQLVQFMAETDLLDYFTLQINLGELEEEGQIKTRPHPFGILLHVTEDGKQTLSSFVQRIPQSRRQILEQQLSKWKTRFQTEQQAPASFFITGDQKLCIRLQMYEGNDAMLDLLLIEPNGHPPTFLAERWRKNVPEIYRLIVNSLGNESEQAQETEQPILQKCSDGCWLMNLGNLSNGDDMIMLMKLPNEQMIHQFSVNWKGQKDSLRAEIMRLLYADPQTEAAVSGKEKTDDE